MDKEEFIKLVKSEISGSATESIIENLIDPPGRKPSPELKAQSEFYNSLSEDKKKVVNTIISEVANEAIFGFLCVLDGVRSISKADELNNLELTHVGNSRKTLLNSEQGEYLHDIYNRA